MGSRRNSIIKLILLGLILILLPTILYLTCKNTLFNTNWLLNLPSMLKANKLAALFILTGLQALQVIICIIPGQPIQFTASYLFGIIGGYLISIIGAIIGSFTVFYLAKVLGYDAIKLIFGENKVENYRLKINSGKGLLITFLIYLIPGFPKDIMGYIAGISNMRILSFLIVSSIGRSPGMFGSLFFGKFFQNNNFGGIIVLVAFCIVILLVCFIFKNKLINLLDELEAKDIEREVRHDGKKTNK